MRRLASAYLLLGTPAFLALDYLVGVNVRTVFLDGSQLRLLYYAGAFGCGLVGWRRPALAPLLGMVESGVNLALLVVGIYLPVLEAGEALESGAATSPVLTPRGLVNAALSGLMFAAAFYGNQAALIGRRARR